MVQAPDVSVEARDLPQALILLSEMNVSAQHVATLVDNMIQKVRNGELTTDQGLSFLEMKYNMLLSYLINLTFVVLRKCSGEKIVGDPCIDRLVEIRTILEKIRPIDHKLKYQIDKLVKTAVSGISADNPINFKADIELPNDSDDNGDEILEKENESGIYVAPKLSAVYYKGDESTQERNKRLEERTKKHAISSAIMQDLREEYLDTPVEHTESNKAQQVLTKQQKERENYEEEYYTRLPRRNSEKYKKRQLSTLGSLGQELTNFGDRQTSSNKRKRKVTKKSKKNFKRKRTH